MEEVSNEVRVKDEPILVNIVKEEPIDIEMQTFKSHKELKSEEFEVKAEKKFSATEEFANKLSIAYFNEEPTQATTSKISQMNQQKSK